MQAVNGRTAKFRTARLLERQSLWNGRTSRTKGPLERKGFGPVVACVNQYGAATGCLPLRDCDICRHREPYRPASLRIAAHNHVAPAPTPICSRESTSGQAAKTVSLLLEVTCLASESLANKETHARPRACNPPNTICHRVPATPTTCNTRHRHPTTMLPSRTRAMLPT